MADGLTPQQLAEWLDRRIEDWRGMSIVGHGLYARYQDAQSLLAEQSDLCRRLLGENQQLRDALAAVVENADPAYTALGDWGVWLSTEDMDRVRKAALGVSGVPE